MDPAFDSSLRLELNGNLLEKQTHSTGRGDVSQPWIKAPKHSMKHKVLTTVLLTFVACLGAFRKDLFQLRKQVTFTLSSFPPDWPWPVPEWPIPPEVNLEHCTDWSNSTSVSLQSTLSLLPNFPYAISTTFELPMTLDVLFFISRGYQLDGQFQIVYSDEVSYNATIEVLSHYWDQKDLKDTQICLLSRKVNEGGVGIFMRGMIPIPETGNHNFLVRLPKAKGSSGLLVNTLETDLPTFDHILGDLKDKVEFKNLIMKAESKPVFVESVYARSAEISTVTGYINGSFHATNSLSLVTKGAPIDVRVNLRNEHDDFSILKISNNHEAPINASVSLTTGKRRGSRYLVSASNAKGPIDVKFVEAPLGSALFVDVRGTFSPVTLKLHETYEGSFLISSSGNQPNIEVDYEVEDPSGQGRNRTIEKDVNHMGFVDGTISWSEEGKSLGGIRLSTVSSVTLKV